MESASASMAKRFQLLFVLPRSLYSIVATYFVVFFFLATVYEYCYGLQPPLAAFMILIILILQALVLQMVTTISSHLSPIATTRRVTASLTIVNGVWLVVTLLILLAKGFNPPAALYSLAFTSFVSSGLDVLIFWPVFTETVWLAIAISALNVLPLALRFFLYISSYGVSPALSFPFALGAGFFLATLITLSWINGAAKKHFHTPSFKLLKAFLDAWTNFNGAALESSLSTFCQAGSVSTYLLEFTTDDRKKTALVVPEVHPGPFAPVGAFDLPGKIHWYLRERGYDDVFVLHGAVDHSLNITSSREVERYLAQLTVPPVDGTFSNRISSPLVKESGDAIVTGIRFGDSLCIFVSVPKGSEDYPSSFRESVKNLCAKIGYRRVVLIDAHDSIGDNPSAALQSDALEGIKQVASELFSAPQYEFSLGCANKAYAFPSISGADIGAGGLGCMTITINGVNYAIVSVDSNNSLVGLRHDIDAALAAKSIKLLEFCTSDSHFNAARIRNKRGYLALGETTPSTNITTAVSSLADQALLNTKGASLGFYEWVSYVQLPKVDLLNQMEATLTSAVNATKKGLLLIFCLLIAELIALLVF